MNLHEISRDKEVPLPGVAEFWARHEKVVGKACAKLETKGTDHRFKIPYAFPLILYTVRWWPFLKKIAYWMLSALSTVERDIRWKKKDADEQANKVYLKKQRDAATGQTRTSLRLVLSASVQKRLDVFCPLSLPLHPPCRFTQLCHNIHHG